MEGVSDDIESRVSDEDGQVGSAQAGLERWHLVERGELVEHDPDAALVALL